MRVQLDGVETFVHGRGTRGETEIAALGAYAVSITTVLEQPSALLVSSYVLDLQGRATAVDLWRAGRGTKFQHRDLQLRGVALSRACSLDHSMRLRELLAGELAATVAVDVGEAALADAERAWAPTSG